MRKVQAMAYIKRESVLLACVALAAAGLAPARAGVPPQLARLRMSSVARPVTPARPGLASPLVAPAGAVVEFDAPGAATTVSDACGSSCGTTAYSINDYGEVVGYFTDAAVVPHAFIRGPGGKFVIFDAPGAGLGAGLDEGTVAYAVNDLGAVGGQYEDAALVYHGFIRSPTGRFVTFDAPGAGAAANQGTLAWNINTEGATSGIYFDASNNAHGFVRSATGKSTSFDPPGSTYTFVCEETCLNQEGATAGAFYDANGVAHGFIRSSSAEYTQIDVPGAGPAGTTVASIDPRGGITGYYFDANGVAHGFLRGPGGGYVTFDAPRSNTAGTYPFSMSYFRAVTGQTQDNRGFERFPGGPTAVIEAPDAGAGSNYGTRPSVNNLEGTVTGWYSDSAQLLHGFVWTP